MQKLFSLAEVITPNIPEAEVISDMPIKNKIDMQKAAQKIGNTYGCGVLIKGGHNEDNADDLLYENGKYYWICGKRINNPNTHGTGCTLSSAIAANLAKGFELLKSVERAKKYISEALTAQLDLGKGSGPIMHNFMMKGNLK